MANLIINFLLSYVLLGLVGLFIWFIMAVIYLVCSFWHNPELVDKWMDNTNSVAGNDKIITNKWIPFVLWPYTILAGSYYVYRGIEKTLENE